MTKGCATDVGRCESFWSNRKLNGNHRYLETFVHICVVHPGKVVCRIEQWNGCFLMQNFLKILCNLLVDHTSRSD